MMSKYVILLTIFLLGCQLGTHMRVTKEMEESRVAYKECLEDHASDPSACVSLKEAYYADVKAFRALKRLEE